MVAVLIGGILIGCIKTVSVVAVLLMGSWCTNTGGLGFAVASSLSVSIN